jgi:hypothetical protein
MELAATATVMFATGAKVTVTWAVPLTPSLVAVSVTGPPGATPVTSPAWETDAIAGFAELQETTRPVRTLPWASRKVAVAWVVAPTTMELVATVTTTVATGAGGGGGGGGGGGFGPELLDVQAESTSMNASDGRVNATRR